jgi:pimeloyl-ACP methyl ester carboxylesterase
MSQGPADRRPEQDGQDHPEEENVEKVTSADGTPIAYEAWGDGPAVVIVGGAFNDRGTWAELAQALAQAGFTGVSYDRRGRGASGDTAPYALEREFEDLAAVVAAVSPGAPAFAHAISSGAALLVRAVAYGVPVSKVSVLEPPYRLPGAPPLPERYIETLSGYVASDDRAGLVEYFQTRVVGLPPQMLESIKGTPLWDDLLAMAPTLVYDGVALGGNDHSVPRGLLSGLEVPVLAVTSTGTRLPWLAQGAEAVAVTAPRGRLARLEGGFHEVPTPVLAPALAEFYRGVETTSEQS